MDKVQSIKVGKRFGFGKNWENFLFVVNDDRIREAENSLKMMTRLEDFFGKNFLDIGSGSGLFSLAARRLGARVCSFDYDERSVNCTRELKNKYFPGDGDWIIERGDVLDVDYLEHLGQFDVVYAWGVLHHTGAMWTALKNVAMNLKREGYLYIAIYNDQGFKSIFWRMIKIFYCSSFYSRFIILAIFIPCFALAAGIKDILSFRNPVKRYYEYKKKRGMSMMHDWIDWLGGYPFEFARPDKIISFYKNMGLKKVNEKICGKKSGCNEFLFIKTKG